MKQIALIFLQSALPQRGGEVNLTLGGIDLNNSGRCGYSLYVSMITVIIVLLIGPLVCSVVVREDKKLLTVLFPDGRDGRAFTLKVHHL